ncbi:MAG: hypothetical protein QOF01_1287 [Thermomicrobiales bacterium]|jgi:predicted nucleic acid-binding protein|nr:hypothetical protein [Thermomicrobiales bacterium]
METASRPCFVVDSSVATKWHLRDEEFSDLAVALLVAYREGRINLIAPDHIRYEVPSAIRKTVRTGRLTAEQARSAIADFLAWKVPTVGSDEVIVAGYEQTVRFGCSLYDGLYVALADALRCPLVHADVSLRNALGPMFSHAIWIEVWTI